MALIGYWLAVIPAPCGTPAKAMPRWRVAAHRMLGRGPLSLGLRRLKCRWVGHAPQGYVRDRPSPPGLHFCGRCDALVPPKPEPMTEKHVAILMQNGWPEALARKMLGVPL